MAYHDETGKERVEVRTDGRKRRTRRGCVQELATDDDSAYATAPEEQAASLQARAMLVNALLLAVKTQVLLRALVQLQD